MPKAQDTVNESKEMIRQAEKNFHSVKEENWSCSEEELKKSKNAVERRKQQDDYEREKQEKDHKAKIERDNDDHKAHLTRRATDWGLFVAGACFLAAIIILAIHWFHPFLSEKTEGHLITFITFGFGIIARDVIGNLFSNS